MTRALSPDELLRVWERGRDSDALRRALLLWEVAEPELTPRERADAPLGRRDGALFALRIAEFGARAECFVGCPSCEAELEFELDLAALSRVPAPKAAPEREDGTWELVEHGWALRFRLPGSGDLEAALRAPDPERALLERCVVAAGDAGGTATLAAVPTAVVAALEAEMARLDPLGEVTLELRCDACGASWTAPFDVASFLWREVEVAARRLLREVDALARAYAWSEREILALDPLRRRSYLELVGAL